MLTAEELIRDDAEGENIRSAVDLSTRNLFGRHERGLALQRGVRRLRDPADRLGDSEVRHLHHTVVGDEDVLG
ncbi:hypothetical protein D3C83_214770 [compost metagenome]